MLGSADHAVAADGDPVTADFAGGSGDVFGREGESMACGVDVLGNFVEFAGDACSCAVAGEPGIGADPLKQGMEREDRTWDGGNLSWWLLQNRVGRRGE